VRIVVLAGLAVGAIAVFAPEHGAGLMQSVGAWVRLGDRARDRAQHFWPSLLVTAIAESPGTVEEDGGADLQQRIGNGKDPPKARIYQSLSRASRRAGSGPRPSGGRRRDSE
jgi:hypothetical protein